MTQRSSVVGNERTLTKPELHSLLMQGWARAIAKNGKGAFADAIGISGTALDKQLTGSMPGFECIDLALDQCPTVLDEYFARKGKRIVDAEQSADLDDLNLLLARALVIINQATHPESPGGRNIVHTEYLEGEEVMRAIHKASGDWLERCSDIRRPRVVKA